MSSAVRPTSQQMGRTHGWEGELFLEFDHVSNAQDVLSNQDLHMGSTRLIRSQSLAPLKVQRPFFPEGANVCHSVIVHTAGGMVGGDRLNLALNLQPSAHAVVTTAAASKVYKSHASMAQQSIQMRVGEGACLEWLPQPLIMFNGAHYQQNLRVDLAPDALWMGWDITRLGRTLRNETFDRGIWRSRVEVWQDGLPLWIDPQWIQGGEEMLNSPHGLAHCPVIGTFALVGVDASDDIIEKARTAWRECMDETASHAIRARADAFRPHEDIIAQDPLKRSSTGVSKLQSGLICRYRGYSTIAAQRWFMAVWHELRQTYLSRPACIPRVWQVRQS